MYFIPLFRKYFSEVAIHCLFLEEITIFALLQTMEILLQENTKCIKNMEKIQWGESYRHLV